jgi:hypothetical protein
MNRGWRCRARISAQFVTAGHSFRTYGWGEAGNLVDRLLASFSLEATVGGAKQ